jgi:NlpC/P60 family putative phage cell wall peptidase
MRADIVALARGWLGTPYHHQASLKGVGCDCLGLIRGVYAEACGRPAETPPPYSRDWAEASARETMIEAAGRHMTRIDPGTVEPGDVLIFRLRPGAMAKHCAIVTEHPGPASGPAAVRMAGGQIKFIHAIEGAAACEVYLTPWWRRRIAAAYRFPDQEDSHAEQPVQHP